MVVSQSLGNGTLLTMVYNKVYEELIQHNEEMLWNSEPVKTNVNPNAYEHLKPQRDAFGDRL